MLDLHSNGGNDAVVSLLCVHELLSLRFFLWHKYFLRRVVLPYPEKPEICPKCVTNENVHESTFLQKTIVVARPWFSLSNGEDPLLRSYGEVLFCVCTFFSGVVLPLVFRERAPPNGSFSNIDKDITDFGMLRQDFCQFDRVGSRNQSVFFRAETIGGKRSSTQA